ncbi:DUF456 domain-containing protein [Heliophilum fasciatum]|uniref:DUF456 family protein n=1 Tax=Heliophilum fasciatum TaxID=35700 RepID=A0A4R2RHW9_9FIRM|nr:DUF456 domain-containing protein [Heliophilum fasciatum]MCW2278906.1 uncharacterized protein YqgC (DUF456 family) [Heliophilum fasciatum]TCP62039.1 hypothetical protein EDD73_12412 [Heliophilum fasciatum]
MHDAWLIGTILVMLVGVLGTVLPVLPGIPLIFIAMVGYGYAEGYQQMSLAFLGVNLLIVLISLALDYAGTAWGARRFGATSSGATAAAVGGLVGVLVLGPFGLVLGPFLGAIGGEVLQGRKLEDALEAGIGTMLGLAGASAIRFILSLAMVAFFVWRIW